MREDSKILINALFTKILANAASVITPDGTINAAGLMNILQQTFTAFEKPVTNCLQTAKGSVSYEMQMQFVSKWVKYLGDKHGWRGDKQESETKVIAAMRRKLLRRAKKEGSSRNRLPEDSNN